MEGLQSKCERPWNCYDCTYEHDGSTWYVRITAWDWDDAEARVAKLGSLKLEGRVVAEIAFEPRDVRTSGIIVQVVCNLANGVRRFFSRCVHDNSG
jgi:hypothetical protein